MERDWLDVPDLRPLDGAALFGGESLAGGAGLGQHRGEDCGVEVAHVERGFAAPDYGSYDAGEGFHAAHGCDGVRMFARDGADLEGEFCCGGECVAAHSHWG